ncbi:MAG TPA: hypothetical protein VF121_12825 [Thermoanaerobaculia bacterium]|nr:hypothetical protein [Thermoanaerobaculia bacterium]
MLGAYDGSYTGPNKWQVSTSWRYQRSDRHFRGSHQEENRQFEHSEVINTLNLIELGVRYNYSDQTSFSLGIPYVSAERSSPLRDSNRVVVDRAITEARELGDVTLTARRLLWKPAERPNGNVSLGLGLKLPTGRHDVYDERVRLVNGQRVTTVESVDQSIQPGDGGFGVILDAQALQRVLGGKGALYAGATYLVNPEGTNGTPTFRNNEGEEIMSIADQYLGRIGMSYSAPSWKGFGVSLGGRLEGVPVHDLVGDSEGFRRPGYAVSVEPGISYSTGPHAFTLAVPAAVYRNRTRSFADRLEPGEHGDAAFADYIVMLGYWRRF